jgi:hypothetical protein
MTTDNPKNRNRLSGLDGMEGVEELVVESTHASG